MYEHHQVHLGQDEALRASVVSENDAKAAADRRRGERHAHPSRLRRFFRRLRLAK